jgi:hypothetical protein
LARTLQRRKMICHCDCMVPIRISFSEGQAEDPILLGFRGLGQWRGGLGGRFKTPA